MTGRTWGLLAAMLGAASCVGSGGGADQPVPVLLNGRQFTADTMQRLGAGCTMYRLGSGEGAESGGGSSQTNLVVRERLAGDQIIVFVTENDRTIVEHQYGEPFFAAGTVDEFTAQPSAGGEGLLLRYWGRLDPASPDDCTPLDRDQP